MAVNALFWRKLCFASGVPSAMGCTRMKTLCFIACLVIMCINHSDAASNSGFSCSSVKSIFETRGLSTVDILDEPINGGVCGSGQTCCGGNSLAATARRDLESSARILALRVAQMMQNRARKFDDVFRALLTQSKLGFHQMFTRTYGLIYERHAHLFAELFSDLERYHSRGDLDLARAMDSFFAVLYQKMFTVLNSQYHFDDKYLSCVSEHMRELQPFGDVPKKMAVQVKRAFVATRTFTRALVTAADVARNMVNLRVQPSCGAVLVRPKFCGACSGVVEKACPNLCYNAVRGCLPFHADLSADWDAFVDAMDKVADRLIGPFNIAMVVEPIDIKISEAIMNFQERSQELSETVFSGCGKPVLGQKPVDTRYFSNPRMTRSISTSNNNQPGYSDYTARRRDVDNSDDFEIETSEESLLKKNPFLLSRGNSRKHMLGENDKVDRKSDGNINLNMEEKNDIAEDLSSIQDRKNLDRRMVYERLVAGSRIKREADPEPAKESKEIQFESYNFDSDGERGGRKRGRKKQGGGKKKKIGGEDISEDISPSSTGLDVTSEDSGDSTINQSLEKMVKEAQQRVRETKRIWTRSTIFCDNLIASEGDDKCWNGTHLAKYLPGLAGEGSAAMATNPELRGSSGSVSLPSVSFSSATPSASFITAQQFTLRGIVVKLKNAYNGLDVEWGEEESASLTYGSGSGSGDIPDTDDDDKSEPGGPPDQEEGSGHHIPESPKFDHKDPDQDLDERFVPSVNNNPPPVHKGDDRDSEIDHNSIDSDGDKESANTSGAEAKEEMSLQRALITYLFPIVCVWFGGIISDIA